MQYDTSTKSVIRFQLSYLQVVSRAKMQIKSVFNRNFNFDRWQCKIQTLLRISELERSGTRLT